MSGTFEHITCTAIVLSSYHYVRGVYDEIRQLSG